MRDPSFDKLRQDSDFQRRTSLVREFWDFLRVSKKWWLLPIVVMLLAVGMLISLGGTAAAPFIYTLF
jgi:hypothetical protein